MCKLSRNMFKLKSCYLNQITPLIIALIHLMANKQLPGAGTWFSKMHSALAFWVFSRLGRRVTSSWALSSTLTPDNGVRVSWVTSTGSGASPRFVAIWLRAVGACLSHRWNQITCCAHTPRGSNAVRGRFRWSLGTAGADVAQWQQAVQQLCVTGTRVV